MMQTRTTARYQIIHAVASESTIVEGPSCLGLETKVSPVLLVPCMRSREYQQLVCRLALANLVSEVGDFPQSETRWSLGR